MPESLGAQLLGAILGELRRLKTLGERAMAQLADQEIFTTIDPESNSVAILVKHLAGNMRSRWTDVLTTDGEKPDRRRDDEFVIAPGTTRADVMGWWEDGWRVALGAIAALSPDDLTRTVHIRGEPHTVVEALHRQLAHCAGHVGQIVFLAKHLRAGAWQTLSIPRGQSAAFARTGRGPA